MATLLAVGLLGGAPGPSAQEPPPPPPVATDTEVPGEAPRSTFLPTADLRVFTNGNVNVVGREESAVGASVGLNLPYTLIRPLATWSFNYSTGAQVYGRDNDRANDLAHNLSTSYRRTISRRSSFGANLSGSRSQQQGYDVVRPDQVITLVPRTDVTRLAGGLNGHFSTGTRSYISVGVSGGLNKYDDIPEGELDPEPDPGEPPPPIPSARVAFVDSSHYGGNLGWGLVVSQRTTMGVGYSYNEITFDEPGTLPPELIPPRDTTVHSAFVNGARRFSEYTTGTIQVGALAAQQEGVEDRVEPSINATLVRQVSQESTLSFGLRQSVGAGNGRRDASLDRGVFGSWNWHRPRVSGTVALGYWDRETLNPVFGSRESTRTFQMTETFGWTPGVRFSYGVFHAFRDQQADDAALDAKGYHSGGLFVRWNIRGRSARVG